MPYQVQQMIEDKAIPVCVSRNDPVTKALPLMIEHDYSQLPVVKKEHDFDVPERMITHEGILRGIRNFNAKIEELKVRDVMADAPLYSLEDDLFDILDRLKETNAVLVKDIDTPELVGIVTSYDATEYFRNRTEDLMRVEDIELIVKDFITAAYTDDTGEVDEVKLNTVITKITAYRKSEGQNQKQLAFDDLTLGDYINLLLHKETWNFIEPIFDVQRSFIGELLNGIRLIRNALAHFRGDITAEQRDRLKFGAEWLAGRQEEYQAFKERQEIAKLLGAANKQGESKAEFGSTESALKEIDKSVSSTDFSVTEAATGGGRYAALADWLQSRPGRIDKIQLTFSEIEEIIEADLPASARNHRAWWANDSVGHTHSQLWLEAGWRTTYINLSEGKITFTRIREREKAYITFFSKLLDEFRNKADFPIREASPDGASWIVIQTIPREGASFGSFTFSFSRDKRLRVELYLDLADKEQTKAAFDKLFAQNDQFEAQVGEIEWERLNNRRASRLAVYHDGHIMDDEKHAELREWAATTMVNFYNTLVEPAESAIHEAKKA